MVGAGSAAAAAIAVTGCDTTRWTGGPLPPSISEAIHSSYGHWRKLTARVEMIDAATLGRGSTAQTRPNARFGEMRSVGPEQRERAVV